MHGERNPPPAVANFPPNKVQKPIKRSDSYLGSNKIEGSTKVQCLPIVLITFRPYIHSYLSHLISLLEVSEVNSKGNIVLMVDKPL